MKAGAAALLDGRTAVIDDTSLRGRAMCRALSDATDRWLAALFEEATRGDGRGLTLVATGGYGRQELAPGSDLDVWLLHDGRDDVSAVAERLWYPIWDAGLKLGHAVRTPKQAQAMIGEDLDTATASLSARHVAGETALASDFVGVALDRWRRKGVRWLDTLHVRLIARHGLAGEVAFLLEPDLKEGRGGLRDIHALRWAEATRPVMLPGDAEVLTAAEDTLLDVRVALHRLTKRAADDLLLDRQDEVAAALGDADADALMARVSAAGRTVAWVSDEAWRREMSTFRTSIGRAFRRERSVGPGLVLRDQEIHVDPAADFEDRSLVLRAGAVAAASMMPIDRQSLDLLAARAPALDGPWPDAAREALVDLLSKGHAAIPVLETLDQRHLLERVLPEWGAVRSKPQRNALHRFTVDRHLCEAAANAAGFTTTVGRPDLLLIGTWLHDIGKGYPGDHTDVGIELVTAIGARMGFPPDDVDTLVAMVRHHLLLPDVATRRDLSDPHVIQGVAAAAGSLQTLELLAALTEADSRATGPSAWGPWKAELVNELVRRAAHVLRGGEPEEQVDGFPGAEVRALMALGRTVVRVDAPQLTVVAPDRPGLFSRVAGTLALKGLTVLAAEAGGGDGMAASQFRVESGGTEVSWDEVVADVRKAIDGRLAIEARLAQRARTGRRMPAAMRLVAEPSVRVDNTASGNSTVVEVRAPDRLGVLYRITRAFADLDLDIRSAKVATLGHEVVDSFYVRTTSGSKIEDRDHVRELERAILHQLSL
ncbi:MAG: glnD [Acidimicrobiales bacterium]|nr:glnD [Acidimicrobiales bacterium]